MRTFASAKPIKDFRPLPSAHGLWSIPDAAKLSWPAPRKWYQLLWESLTAGMAREILKMKGKKHTPDQIIAKLREAEAELNGGSTLGQVCQKLGISE
jgi:hypothetical protein